MKSPPLRSSVCTNDYHHFLYAPSPRPPVACAKRLCLPCSSPLPPMPPCVNSFLVRNLCENLYIHTSRSQLRVRKSKFRPGRVHTYIQRPEAPPHQTTLKLLASVTFTKSNGPNACKKLPHAYKELAKSLQMFAKSLQKLAKSLRMLAEILRMLAKSLQMLAKSLQMFAKSL